MCVGVRASVYVSVCRSTAIDRFVSPCLSLSLGYTLVGGFNGGSGAVIES